MEHNEIQKTLEVKRQAINTETTRLLQLNNEIVILSNAIELYKIESASKLAAMQHKLELMERSFNSGNKFIEDTQRFIDKYCE